MPDHQAARASFAKRNLVIRAKLAHAVQVAEKIQDKGFAVGEQRKSGGPELRRLPAAHRFAAFRFEQFETYRFDFCS